MMDRFHLAKPTQNPLFIRIGSEVIARRPMSRHIEKHVRILRRRVFGSVRRRKTHHHHERLMVKVLFRLAQKTDGIIGDQIRVVICLVVVAVFDLKGDVG